MALLDPYNPDEFERLRRGPPNQPPVGYPEPPVPGAIPTPRLAPPAPEVPSLVRAPQTGTTVPLQTGTTVPTSSTPDQQELTRLTAPPLSGQMAHTKADTGQSGVGQIKHAGLRIPLQILSALGDAVVPALTMGIPGTQLHHDMLVHNARRNVGDEQAAAAATTARQKAGAEAEELGARTAHENAAAKLAGQQADTMAEEGKRAPKGNYITVGTGLYDASEGKWIREPQDKADLYEISPERGKALGLTPNDKGEYWIPKQAVGSLLKPPAERVKSPEEQFIEEFHSNNPGSTIADAETAFKKIQPPEKPERPPQTMMIGPDGVAKVVRPGDTVDPGSRTPQQQGSVNTPTMQMRTAGSRAELAASQVPGIIQEVTRLKDQLGPLTGRWNEFMQGKVGAPNQEIAGLRTDLIFLSSAVALAHAVGRLPENLREEFDQLINAPKQDPDNMVTILTHVQKWMHDNAKYMKGEQGQAPGVGGAVNARAGENQGNTSGRPPTITTKDEYDKLPSGAHYIRDGVEKTKR